MYQIAQRIAYVLYHTYANALLLSSVTTNSFSPIIQRKKVTFQMSGPQALDV